MVFRRNGVGDFQTQRGEIWLWETFEVPQPSTLVPTFRVVNVRSILIDNEITAEQACFLRESFKAEIKTHEDGAHRPVWEVIFPQGAWNTIIMAESLTPGVTVSPGQQAEFFSVKNDKGGSFGIRKDKTLDITLTEGQARKTISSRAESKDSDFHANLLIGQDRVGFAESQPDGTRPDIPEALPGTERLCWVAHYNQKNRKWDIKIHYAKHGSNYALKYGMRIKDRRTIQRLTGCLDKELDDYDFS